MHMVIVRKAVPRLEHHRLSPIHELQRLAVDHTAQRQGHGRQLTLDSLRWMQRRRLDSAVVNTGITNEAALALYESVGFRPLADRLVVMQRSLPAR